MRQGVPGPGVGRFRHEAVFYRGLDELTAMTVPFVIDGLERSEPVLLAVPPDRIRSLRAALGRDAERVSFVDMSEVGGNPARIIPVWRRFVRDCVGAGSGRGVGEPVWSGRTDVELEECRLHESLVNVAFDDGPAWRLLCPYDTESLPETVVEDAMRTHPVVAPAPQDRVEYAGHRLAEEAFTSPLPPVPRWARRHSFEKGDLSQVRRVARGWAREEGLSRNRAGDLVLAVHELATNSVVHGGGGGVLRAWTELDSFVVEVADSGRISDPLVGREVAPELAEGGRGVWIVIQLCDLVQVRSGGSGTVVRLHSRL